MKTLYVLISLSYCFVTSAALSAQQQFRLNDMREHQDLFNPAALYDGYDNYHNLYMGILYREPGMGQANLPLKPNTMVAKGSWVGNFFQGGYFKPLLGGHISSRSFGVTQFNDINLRFGAVNISNRSADPSLGNAWFSAAINFSLKQIRLRASKTKGLIAEDPTLQSDYTQSIPNLGVGVYHNSRLLWGKVNFYAGASIPSFFSMDLETASVLEGEELEVNFNPAPHFITGFKLYNRSLKAAQKNSFLECTNWVFKDEYDKLIFDTNIRYFFGPYNFWLGSGYASNEVIHTQLGFEWYKGFGKNKKNTYRLKQPLLRISMNYDLYTGNIKRPLESAFELSIQRLIRTR